MFSDFDKYISSSFSTDYWSDEGISHAAGIVSEFTEKDWEELTSSLPKRNECWQIRCADSLGDVENNPSLNTLLKLLNSENAEVKIAVLDSVSALLSCGLNAADHQDKVRRVIEQINSESSVVNMMLKSLEAKL